MAGREVVATYIPDVERFFDFAIPGQYAFMEDGRALLCRCPCGCDTCIRLPIVGPYAWAWNGSIDRPTITPSIRQLTGCHYHGHLTAGVWTFASDSGRGR